MSLLSRLQHQISTSFSEVFHRAPKPTVDDPRLQSWALTQTKVSAGEAQRLVTQLAGAMTRHDRVLDLSGTTPAVLEALGPKAHAYVTAQLSQHVDHLVLPRGCSAEVLRRWLPAINPQELSAPHLKLRKSERLQDHELPPRLAIVRSEVLPIPEEQLAGSARVFDTRPSLRRHSPAALRLRSDVAAPAGPGSIDPFIGQLEDYQSARSKLQTLSDRLAATPAPAGARLSAPELQQLRATFLQLPVDALAPAAREACHLARQRLEELPRELAGAKSGGKAPNDPQRGRLNTNDVQHMLLALDGALHALTVRGPDGPTLIGARQLQEIYDMRRYVQGGDSVAERELRARQVEVTLQVRSGVAQRGAPPLPAPSPPVAAPARDEDWTDVPGSMEPRYRNLLPDPPEGRASVLLRQHFDGITPRPRSSPYEDIDRIDDRSSIGSFGSSSNDGSFTTARSTRRSTHHSLQFNWEGSGSQASLNSLASQDSTGSWNTRWSGSTPSLASQRSPSAWSLESGYVTFQREDPYVLPDLPAKTGSRPDFLKPPAIPPRPRPSAPAARVPDTTVPLPTRLPSNEVIESAWKVSQSLRRQLLGSVDQPGSARPALRLSPVMRTTLLECLRKTPVELLQPIHRDACRAGVTLLRRAGDQASVDLQPKQAAQLMEAVQAIRALKAKRATSDLGPDLPQRKPTAAAGHTSQRLRQSASRG